jgi:predicted nucleotidyltransferase
VTEDLLRPNEQSVVDRVIAEEQGRREHVVIALSGAHAYGFPSPDSDVDMKAVHVDPTDKILGFGGGAAHADRMEVIDGVEIDYTSNEIKPVLSGVIQGNGNYIERILGRTLLQRSPALDPLKPLVQRALSRRVFRHYLGFATSQLKAFEADGRGSVKKLLYVLRTALTGAHALRAGEIVTDLGELAGEYGFPEARELIAAKRSGEKSRMTPEQADRWSAEVTRAFASLEAAYHESSLPAEPAGVSDLEAWLLAERRKRL